jgi:hypothetical protein
LVRRVAGVRQRAMQVWFAARERRRVEKATPPVAPRKRIVLGDMVVLGWLSFRFSVNKEFDDGQVLELGWCWCYLR